MPDARFLQIHSLHGYSAVLLNRDDSGLAKRNKGQVGLSKAVRKALAETGMEAAINGCAQRLLPEHAR